MEKTGRKMGATSLFFMLAGTMIGPSIVLYVGYAIASTGFSAWVALILGMSVGLFLYAPLFFVSSAIKLRGGEYSIVAAMGGRKLAGVYAYCSLPTYIGISSLAVGAGSYIHAVFPNVGVNVAAATVATVFFVLNILGIRSLSKAQNALTITLFLCLLMYVAFGITKINQPIFNFSGPEFFTNGGAGLFAAVGIMSGMGQTVKYAVSYTDLAEDPKKNIPLTMIKVPVALMILYLLVCIVSEGVLPLSETAGKVLTVQAGYLMPKTLVAVFILFGPVMALMTSLNGFFTGMGMPIVTNARNGWFPKFLMDKNRFDAYWKTMIVLYIICIFPIATGMSLTKIVQNGFILAAATGYTMIICLFRFPKLYPEAWAQARFKVPNAVYYVFCTLSFIAETFIVIYSVSSLSITNVIINLVIIVVFAVAGVMRSKSENVEVASAISVD